MTREELIKNLQKTKQDKEELWLSLNRKLKKAEKKLSQLKKTNKTLQTQCKSLQSQIDYLRRSIERKEEQIKDLEQERVPYTNEYTKKLEKTINKAIWYIKHNADKGYNFGWILQNEELNQLLQILERTDK